MTDPRTFREIVRTVTVSYPIPFLVALLVAAGVICLGMGAVGKNRVAWLAAGAGGVMIVAACAIAIYAVLRRPDLLRSERHSLMTRAIDILMDKDVSERARDRAGTLLDGLLAQEDIPKRALRGPAPSRLKPSDNQDA